MKKILLILALMLPFTVLPGSPAFAEASVEATIFSFDGRDFVRSKTTLMEDGQSAAETKLDHGSAAYKALVKKHSYTGPTSLFGHDYEANYAPLVGNDGELTGALFIGVPK